MVDGWFPCKSSDRFHCAVSCWVSACSTLIPKVKHLFLEMVSMTNRLLHVDCQKAFPDVPSKFHVSGRRLWSRLSIPQGLGTTELDPFSLEGRDYSVPTASDVP